MLLGVWASFCLLKSNMLSFFNTCTCATGTCVWQFCPVWRRPAASLEHVAFSLKMLWTSTRFSVCRYPTAHCGRRLSGLTSATPANQATKSVWLVDIFSLLFWELWRIQNLLICCFCVIQLIACLTISDALNTIMTVLNNQNLSKHLCEQHFHCSSQILFVLISRLEPRSAWLISAVQKRDAPSGTICWATPTYPTSPTRAKRAKQPVAPTWYWCTDTL